MKGKENHNIEFKQAWQEKCMDTVCAFANTNGGSIFIGKNDHGKVIGVENSKALMDEIPNKITSILGFAPDVRLKREKLFEYIEIIIKPQSYAVALRGKYYTRSGSSTLELKGAQLQNFLLAKGGQDWESLIEEEATIQDIKPATIQKFKELSKKRFPSASNEVKTDALLEKLHLIKKNKLTKAAILLFGKNPQKFFKNAQFKIGAFVTDTELKSTDVIEGNLFEQVEQIFELLKNKYLVYHSKIDGLYRTEELEYPEEALREAIINSIVHRDYIGAHTQLRLFPDKLTLWNYGELPSELSFERLRKQHQSLPRNTKIADVFYKAGLIEAWGRGTTKMIEELTKAGLPEPLYENRDGGFSLSFLKDVYSEDFLIKTGLNARQIKAVLQLKTLFEMNNQKYTEITGTSERTASRDLAELVAKKILEQSGSTGKGTVYTLRRHKGAKDAKNQIINEKTKDAIKTPKTPSQIENIRKTSVITKSKGATKGPKTTQRGHKGATSAIKRTKKAAGTPIDPLDRKLLAFEAELNKLDPNQEIKDHFSRENFFKIYDGWLSELLENAILVGQKFNKYFAEKRHAISAINGYWSFGFTDATPKTILKKFRDQAEKGTHEFSNNNLLLQVYLYYNALKKGGLKTFNCSYYLEISFNSIGYKIHLTEFGGGGNVRSEKPEFEHLLHRALTKKEITQICNKLGDAIFEQIQKKRTI